MKLANWQKMALGFPYQNSQLHELLYIEFFAASGLDRKPRADKGKPRGKYVMRDVPRSPTLVAGAGGEYVFNSERDAEFIQKFKSGMTLDAIGVEYGITRERVRQRLAKHGLSKLDGGIAIRSFKRVGDKAEMKRAMAARVTDRHFKRWGCDAEFIDSVSPLPRSNSQHPVRKYETQRKNAVRKNGCGWEFTFKTWWDVWQKSGKWDERGRGKYVMGRYGDSGAYAPDNVEIITASQNSKDSYIVHPSSERAKKARITRLANLALNP